MKSFVPPFFLHIYVDLLTRIKKNRSTKIARIVGNRWARILIMSEVTQQPCLFANTHVFIKKYSTYTVKKGYRFSHPSRDVTNQTLPDREFLDFSRRGRVWLVTSPGDRKNDNLFYSVVVISKARRLLRKS
jgi:hypothetical protein